MPITGEALRNAGWRSTMFLDGAGGAWTQQYENRADPRLILLVYATARGAAEKESVWIPELDRQFERLDWDGMAEALTGMGDAVPGP